jgi:hypothetical protein
MESAFDESLESGCRFCVDAFNRNPAPVDLKMFTHLIAFIKEFTFSMICKDDAINYITVQHEVSFPSTLTDHMIG